MLARVQGGSSTEFRQASIERLLTRRLAEVTSGDLPSPADFFGRLNGLYPADAVRLARELGLSAIEDVLRHRSARPASSPTPGHILDSEWFFDRETQHWLTDRVLAHGARRVLLLGCPTMVDRLLGSGLDVTLVDNSVHGVDSFIRDKWARKLTLETLRIGSNEDLDTAFCPEFDAVIMDPPWYLPAYAAFLSHALKRTQEDALVLSTLMQRFTRPTATAERRQLLKIAWTVGTARLNSDALTYQTPIFEAESLRAAGLPNLGNWRRGDLIEIRRTLRTDSTTDLYAALNDVSQPLRTAECWEEVRVGDQYIKFRRTGPPSVTPPQQLIEPVLPTGYQLRTVSRRELNGHEPHVWSSKNRTAHSSDPMRLADVLQELSVSEMGQTMVNYTSKVPVRRTPALDSLTENEAEHIRDFIYSLWRHGTRSRTDSH